MGFFTGTTLNIHRNDAATDYIQLDDISNLLECSIIRSKRIRFP